VLVSVLVTALGISLFTVDRLSRQLLLIGTECRHLQLQLEQVKSERDTLVGLVRAFSGRCDSLEDLKWKLDSLAAYASMMELRSNYVGYYLLIDTYQNRFHLRRRLWNGTELLVRSGYCATGKGWTANDSGRVWNFSTPRGLRYVVKKDEKPYWYRPDWFWEEMDMVPPEPDEFIAIPDTLTWEEQIAFYNDSLDAAQRLLVKKVPGALGSYKLDLGGGILIHYGVGLGRNVSHGCIRIGKSDLEALYRVLPVGAPVVIY